MRLRPPTHRTRPGPGIARRTLALLTALATALALTTLAASPAQAVQIDTDAYYLLQNHRSGLVADVPDGSTANGTELVQWERNDSAAQQFRFVPAGDGYYRIVNRGSGKAVDVWEWSTQGGAEIRQYDDLGGANQQWMPVDRAGGVQLVNRHSGMALEVWAWSTRQGDRLSQWDPHDGASQIWDLI
ncbi:RICIN domain-containing protein, partial [Nocardiopsis sp. LOL_012]|uniref:RICIN domain-containing protein n=1 Tax=Nocardiopsis sp. LOL_012 TaxID=3345409 RepID=UPI003A884B3B